MDLALETTCGDDALLRHHPTGRCTLVARDGTSRGFTAETAVFSVLGTAGGPYVLEDQRIRVARFAADEPEGAHA